MDQMRRQLAAVQLQQSVVRLPPTYFRTKCSAINQDLCNDVSKPKVLQEKIALKNFLETCMAACPGYSYRGINTKEFKEDPGGAWLDQTLCVTSLYMDKGFTSSSLCPYMAWHFATLHDTAPEPIIICLKHLSGRYVRTEAHPDYEWAEEILLKTNLKFVVSKITYHHSQDGFIRFPESTPKFPNGNQVIRAPMDGVKSKCLRLRHSNMNGSVNMLPADSLPTYN